MRQRSKPSILVVEDTPEDVEAIKRGLAGVGITNGQLHFCEDGDDALDYLRHEGDYIDVENSPRPALVILDLNLPGTDGRQVLEELKQDEELKSIPVVVFTCSDLESDVQGCYAAGANGYVRKPVALPEFTEAVRQIKEFWLDATVLP